MDEAEHRCGRCGRTLDDTLLPGDVVHGAAVPKLRTAPRRTAPPAPPAPIRPGAQSRLFQDDGTPKVIPFPRRPRDGKPRERYSRPAPEGQGNLDFIPQKAKSKTLATTVDAVIRCDIDTAARPHRAIAAAIDCSLVFIGCAFFLLAVLLAGGPLTPNRPTVLAFAGAFALIAAGYGVLPVIAGSETVGRRLAGLRLVTFRGLPPSKKERFYRFLGGWLSNSIVVGLAWSLWDEESLTWQDHMSGTFYTALASTRRVFHNR